MKYLPAPIDPYVLTTFSQNDYFTTVGNTNRQTLGRTTRSPSINPSLKTLVLFNTGQSLWSDILPTLYVPVNYTEVDNFNVFDSNLYDCNGPLIGTTYAYNLGFGPGNVVARVADRLVTNGKFDRIIIVSLAIGSTTIAMWTTGELSNRCSVALQRLASRGITPGMTGVTFACLMGLGEQDFFNGTSQASYTASGQSFITTMLSQGFSRIFWDLESAAGETSNPIRSAEASLWNGTTVFSGGDLDSIPASGRQDGLHFNDLGGLQAQSIVIAAMAASGSPF